MAILDCGFAAQPARRHSRATFQVLAAGAPREEERWRREGSNEKTFTQRVEAAFQYLHSRGSNTTTASLFQKVLRLRPYEAPLSVLMTMSGANPISFSFENDYTPSAFSIPSPIFPNADVERILACITIRGGLGDVCEAFTETFKTLPPNMEIKIVGADATEDSKTPCLVHMSYEVWALWTMVVDLKRWGTFLLPIGSPLAEMIWGAVGAEENVS